MKKLLAGVCFLCMSLWVHGQSVTEIENGFRIYSELETVEVTFFSPSVVRIVKYPKGNTFDKQSLSVVKQPEKVRVKWRFDRGKTALSSSQLVVLWDENRRALTFKNKKGEQLLAEKADAVRFVSMQDAGQPSYRVSQSFVLEDGEAVYGLGQHQQGGLNQRGREVFLQQVNMEIGIPIVHSNKGYAVFWDNYSTTTYKDDKEGMSFTSEVGDGCDYYFINFSLCGIPYWNSDIGAFWTWQNFPDGYKDPAYRKFYVRWMQFAVFTGMMRSHGSNTPREIFNFGQRGDWAFDVQERFINLRYRLLPYIYSNAWQITSENATLMRALFMDYPNDKKVLDLDDEFLFGKSFLIAPVTTPDDKRNVYLPVGTWIDFWTGESVTGGCTLNRQVPIDQVPVYVKAGTVLPIGPTVQHVGEKVWDDLQIRIYPGADGEFVLYEDAGDTYDYEKGAYTTVRFTWDETRKELTIHPREGEFPGMLEKRSFRIVKVDTRSGLGLDNVSADKTVNYVGKKLKINLE